MVANVTFSIRELDDVQYDFLQERIISKSTIWSHLLDALILILLHVTDYKGKNGRHEVNFWHSIFASKLPFFWFLVQVG